MKKLITPTGGQPVNLSDFVDIQNEAYKAIEGQHAGLAFVASGVVVSGTEATADISAGLVYLDGEFLEFAGATGVDFTANPTQYLQLSTATSRPKNFTVGGIKDTRQTTSAVLVTTLPAGDNITLTFTGHTQSYLQVIGKKMMPIGAITMVQDVSDFNTSTGLGSGNWADWRLCNGIGGTLDMRGRFPVGLSVSDVDYNTVGKTGGAKEVTLTIPQMPTHSHTSGDFNRILKVDGTGTVADTDNSPTEPNVTTSAIMQNAGGGLPHENRPPYITINFAVKYK